MTTLETMSGAATHKPQLKLALEQLREGDELVRLEARSVKPQLERPALHRGEDQERQGDVYLAY